MKFAELYLVPKNQFLSFLKYEEGVGGKNAIHVNQLNVTDGERLNIKQILKENGGLQNVLTAARGVKGANQMGGRTARAQGPGPSSGSDPSAGGSHHTSVPGSAQYHRTRHFNIMKSGIPGCMTIVGQVYRVY